MTCTFCGGLCKKFGKDRHESQRYRCRQCGKVLTEPHNGHFAGMYTSPEEAASVLRFMMEGMSIRRRDVETGIFLTDENNELLIDADFDRVLQDLWASEVPEVFPWLIEGKSIPADSPRGWNIRIQDVLAREDLSIDPKRWSERAMTTRQEIQRIPHFTLKDVVDIIAEVGPPTDEQAMYQYVEIQDTADGVITPQAIRGWQLPDRARHGAELGDIFVSRIWSSINKWFVAGGDCSKMMVTNGFYRLRLKPGMEDFLLDLVAGVNTEAYRIQARSYCTGSDGLAEIPEDDLLEIVLPRLIQHGARATMQQIINTLLAGRSTGGQRRRSSHPRRTSADSHDSTTIHPLGSGLTDPIARESEQ